MVVLAAKGMRFPIDVILVCICWYAAYPLSYRHLEEMMQERGVFVDPSSTNCWAIRFLRFCHCLRKCSASTSIRWVGIGARMKRTSSSKAPGNISTAQWTRKANGVPEKVTMDKSGANKAAMDEINARGETPIIVRQVKYLNNIVEQSHRAVKRVTKPMLNFGSFQSAKCVLAGIELMHMIRKGQLMLEGLA